MKRPLTARAARWSASHKRTAIGMWVLFVAGAIVLAALVPTNEATNDDMGHGPSQRAAEMLDDAAMTAPADEQILLTAPDGHSGAPDPVAVDDAVGELTAQLGDLPEVASIGEVVWSASGDTALLPVTLSGHAADASDNSPPVLAVTEDVAARHEALRIEQTGSGSVANAFMDIAEQDLADSTALSMPITLVIMLIAFGALVAAAIPVILALSSVFASFGLYALASYAVPDTGTVANMVMLIGMAVGIDYSLFFVKRQREERQRGNGSGDAVEIAARTAGHSIIISGLSVIVSVSALFLVGDVIFAGLAAGAILVVGVAMLGSLTVLPAVVAGCGRWIDRPRVPLLWRMQRRMGAGAVSGRLVGAVVRRPKGTLIASSALIVVLAAPLVTMRLQDSSPDQLPDGTPAVEALNRLQGEFPSQGTAMSVVATAPEGQGDEVEQALGRLHDDAIASGDFASEGAVLRASDDGATLELELRSVHPLGSSASRDTLDAVRSELAPAAFDDIDDVEGVEWATGGDQAESVDFADQQSSALPLIVAFVLVFMMIVMGLTFRSAGVVLLTLLLSVASLMASFGVLVGVFQSSWAESLLDFESNGAVVSWIPLFVLVVLLGLSMDYHVLALSRIREAARRGDSPQEAIVSGMRQVSGTIVMAALVMVSVFALFAMSGLPDMKQMGFGLAVGVLIDSTLIRIVMLPAVLALRETIVEKMARRGIETAPTATAAVATSRPATAPDGVPEPV